MLRFRYIVLILLSFVLLINLISFFVWKCTHNKVLEIYFQKIFVFFVPIFTLLGIIFCSSAILAKIEYGPTMDEQVKQQFNAIKEKKYNTIILGNSRLYRGINPDIIKDDCYNFAFDNDSFLECYYKLKYLDTIEKLPNKVILGVDYFEFSFVSAGMQATYDLFFDKEYDDIIANCNNISFGKTKDIDTRINKLLNGSCILNYYNTVSYIYYHYIIRDKRISYVSELGQYRIFPQPKATYGDFLTRSSEIMKEQQDAYNNILLFCNDNNIKIILVMLPLRDIEFNCYDDNVIKAFNTLFLNNSNAQFLNYSRANNFFIDDFMDDTHLNLTGADKFSRILNSDLDTLCF